MQQQQPLYSVSLDPETAHSLATHGATLLLLDVPEGTPIGLDQQVFLTGPKFCGVKMLPPGVHFLSYQARSTKPRSSDSDVNSDGSAGGGISIGVGELSPPVSTFLQLAPRSVVVRRWSRAAEGLLPLDDEDEVARYAAGVARFDFDRQLAPYDLARAGQWAALSSAISADVLRQLLPADGEISIMSEAVDPGLMNPASPAEQRLQQQLAEGRARRAAAAAAAATAMQVEQPEQQQQPEQPQQPQQQHNPAAAAADAGAGRPAGRCRYSRLPGLIKVAGAAPAQLTALNVDKSAALEQLLQQRCGAPSSSEQQQQQQQQPRGIGLVGELQFAFVAFVFGQSLEGYMQWKQLIVLLLGCVAAPLESHTQLFVAFLAALTAQLQLGFGLSAGAGGGSGAGRQGEPGAADGAATAGDGGGGTAALLGAGLVEELLPDSFLKAAFRGFFQMLQESSAEAPAPLLAQARVLETVVAAGLGWDFRLSELRLDSDDDDDDDDGPVVVQLSEQQLAALEQGAAAGQAVEAGGGWTIVRD